jgi:uncharacterized cupin superfamily protein
MTIGHKLQKEKSGEQALNRLMAYKRTPDLSNSTWYMGVLTGQMAGVVDNNGAFDASVIQMRRGTEPPPHVHSREDEFFYILSDEMSAYVDGNVFPLTTG